MQSFMVSGVLFGANTLKNVFTNIASALEEEGEICRQEDGL